MAWGNQFSRCTLALIPCFVVFHCREKPASIRCFARFVLATLASGPIKRQTRDRLWGTMHQPVGMGIRKCSHVLPVWRLTPSPLAERDRFSRLTDRTTAESVRTS